MTKKIISLLLVLVIVTGLLTGCGESGPSATQPAEQTAKFGITKEFQTALNNAVILLTDSENCYVTGTKTLVDDMLPIQLGSVLYIPAVFVAKSLGATVVSQEGTLRITYGENTLELSPESESMTVNGSQVSLPMGAVFTEDGVLVPAEVYCQSLGTQLYSEDGLILIGDELEAGIAAATPEESQLMMSALRADLTPTLGMAVPVNGSYADRSAVSYYLALDPLDLPYSTEKDTLVACAGNLYVENLTVDYSLEEQLYTVTMTVYNYLGYCYGSVEVYDKDDLLLELERINPYQGQKSSVVSAFTDIAQLAMDTGKAVWNWDIGYLNYRTDLNSQKTEITVEVPLGGYIFLTCNPTHSIYNAFYDMVYAFVQTAVCATDIGKTLAGVEDSTADAREKLVEFIIKKLMEEPGTVAELAAEFERIFGDNSSVLDPENYLESAAAALLDAFQRAEIDIGGILKDAIEDQLTDVADKAVEDFLTTLLPVTKLALDSWKITANTANLINIFLDMEAVCKCRSIIIDISDWRTAYAEYLQTQLGSGDRYDLLYITDDNIPELVLLHAGGRIGSSARIHTYQNRQVVYIPGPQGPEITIGFGEMQYLEYQSSIIQGNVQEGHTSMMFMVLKDNSFQTEATFWDTELLEGGKENAGFGSYYYNDRAVTPATYYWHLWNIGVFNDGDVMQEKYPIPLSMLYEKAKTVSAYTSGWEITEDGIKEVYFFGW